METLLQNAGERGLSIKQLKVLLKKSTKAVKRDIYNSDCVKRTNPLLHGSGKQRIRVFSYTEPTGISLIAKLKGNSVRKNKKSDQELVQELVQEPDEDFVIV